MNLHLIDASVFLASEDTDDPNHDAANRLLLGSEPLATLDLVYYETANVAIRAWRDLAAARRLLERIAAVADDGGVVKAEPQLLTTAIQLAESHEISVYDAAYVAGAQLNNATLVSCDIRDLVSNGHAVLPAQSLDE